MAYTQEEWSALIKEQSSSGLTVAEFCRIKGIPASSYHTSKNRLNSQNIKKDKCISDVFSRVKVVSEKIPTKNVVSLQISQSQWRLIFPQGMTLEFPASDLRYVLTEISRGVNFQISNPNTKVYVSNFLT